MLSHGRKLFLFVFIIILFSSCSLTHRRYMPGWHVEFFGGKTKAGTRVSSGQIKTASPPSDSIGKTPVVLTPILTEPWAPAPKDMQSFRSLPGPAKSSDNIKTRNKKVLIQLHGGVPDPFSIFLGLLGLFFCAIGLAPIGIWVTFGRGKLMKRVLLFWLGGFLLFWVGMILLSTITVMSPSALVLPLMLLIAGGALFIYAGLLAAVRIIQALFSPARD